MREKLEVSGIQSKYQVIFLTTVFIMGLFFKLIDQEIFGMDGLKGWIYFGFYGILLISIMNWLGGYRK